MEHTVTRYDAGCNDTLLQKIWHCTWGRMWVTSAHVLTQKGTVFPFDRDIKIRRSSAHLEQTYGSNVTRFRVNLTMYLAPEYCESRFGYLYRQRCSYKQTEGECVQCTQDYSDEAAQTSEKRFYETFGQTKGTICIKRIWYIWFRTPKSTKSIHIWWQWATRSNNCPTPYNWETGKEVARACTSWRQHNMMEATWNVRTMRMTARLHEIAVEMIFNM